MVFRSSNRPTALLIRSSARMGSRTGVSPLTTLSAVREEDQQEGEDDTEANNTEANDGVKSMKDEVIQDVRDAVVNNMQRFLQDDETLTSSWREKLNDIRDRKQAVKRRELSAMNSMDFTYGNTTSDWSSDNWGSSDSDWSIGNDMVRDDDLFSSVSTDIQPIGTEDSKKDDPFDLFGSTTETYTLTDLDSGLDSESLLDVIQNYKPSENETTDSSVTAATATATTPQQAPPSRLASLLEGFDKEKKANDNLYSSASASSYDTTFDGDPDAGLRELLLDNDSTQKPSKPTTGSLLDLLDDCGDNDDSDNDNDNNGKASWENPQTMKHTTSSLVENEPENVDWFGSDDSPADRDTQPASGSLSDFLDELDLDLGTADKADEKAAMNTRTPTNTISTDTSTSVSTTMSGNIGRTDQSSPQDDFMAYLMDDMAGSLSDGDANVSGRKTDDTTNTNTADSSTELSDTLAAALFEDLGGANNEQGSDKTASINDFAFNLNDTTQDEGRNGDFSYSPSTEHDASNARGLDFSADGLSGHKTEDSSSFETILEHFLALMDSVPPEHWQQFDSDGRINSDDILDTNDNNDKQDDGDIDVDDEWKVVEEELTLDLSEADTVDEDDDDDETDVATDSKTADDKTEVEENHPRSEQQQQQQEEEPLVSTQYETLLNNVMSGTTRLTSEEFNLLLISLATGHTYRWGDTVDIMMQLYRSARDPLIGSGVADVDSLRIVVAALQGRGRSPRAVISLLEGVSADEIQSWDDDMVILVVRVCCACSNPAEAERIVGMYRQKHGEEVPFEAYLEMQKTYRDDNRQSKAMRLLDRCLQVRQACTPSTDCGNDDHDLNAVSSHAFLYIFVVSLSIHSIHPEYSTLEPGTLEQDFDAHCRLAAQGRRQSTRRPIRFVPSVATTSRFGANRPG